jgi:predicted transcriptional regulator
MDLKCKKITNLILPAVRASIAEELYKKYDMKQKDIADNLSIVQVAVSKYLNKKYSKRIENLKNYIFSNKLNDEVIKAIITKENKKIINKEIEKLCTNKNLLELEY